MWLGALSKSFCDSQLLNFDWDKSTQGTVNNGANVVNIEQRRTDVLWLDFMQPLACVAKSYMDSANAQAEWGYKILGQENTQIGRYKSEDNGYYDWHMDADPPNNVGTQRKLSCVILLNDPKDFEGGKLEFEGFPNEEVLTEQGSIIVFPSFIKHRVTPVTKGVRYSAVTWAFGPSFK